MIRLFLMTLLAALFWAAPAEAADTSKLRSPVCNKAKALAATIQQIMAAPSEYRGKCVAVIAVSHGFLLFTSVEGYYLAGPLARGDPDANPPDRERLGLDNLAVMRKIPRDGLRRVTAIGRVQDCEAVRNMAHASAEPGEIVWTTGFCHMASGPYLWLSDVIVGPRLKAHRLMGEKNRAEFGNLVLAPADWRHRAFVQGKVQEYLDAARRRDRAKLRALHLSKEKPVGRGDDDVRLILSGKQPFTDVVSGAGQPQMAIFLEGARAEEPASKDPDEDYFSIVCFCRTANCSDKWPISVIDADNLPDRPYACTILEPYMVSGKGQVPAFATERGQWGMPESRR